MKAVRHASHDASLPAILALLRDCFAYMDGRIDPPTSLHRLTLDDVRAHCRSGELWSIGSPPHACVFLTPTPGALYVGRLAVAPAHRGRGIARELVALAERRAHARDLPALELNVRVELARNRATFAALGFTVVAERAHAGYARPTYVSMRREPGAAPEPLEPVSRTDRRPTGR